MIDFALIYLVFQAFIITSFMCILIGLGAVCSPLAGYITYRRAKRYDLDPIRYMIIGALYSIDMLETKAQRLRASRMRRIRYLDLGARVGEILRYLPPARRRTTLHSHAIMLYAVNNIEARMYSARIRPVARTIGYEAVSGTPRSVAHVRIRG